MTIFKPGDFLRYNYLWARQADAGEEAGRKARPVCLIVRTRQEPARLYLFPLTSRQPLDGRTALAISQMECRRAGLDFPTWLVLDEYNLASAQQLYDLADTRPIGAFSPAFLKKAAGMIKELALAQRLRSVGRG